MKKLIAAAALCFLCLGCRMVYVHIDQEGEKARRIMVPFSLLKTAIRFTDANTIEFDDLGGFSETIDLEMLAKALKEDGDRVSFQVETEDTVINAQKVGKIFQIRMDDSYEESKVTLNLPLALMDALAEGSESGVLQSKNIMRSFRGFSGTLIEVDSPDEKIKVVLK